MVFHFVATNGIGMSVLQEVQLFRYSCLSTAVIILQSGNAFTAGYYVRQCSTALTDFRVSPNTVKHGFQCVVLPLSFGNSYQLPKNDISGRKCRQV